MASEARLAAGRVQQAITEFQDVASRFGRAKDDLLQALADVDSGRWSRTVGNFNALAATPVEILQQPNLRDGLGSLARRKLEEVLSGHRRLDQFGFLLPDTFVMFCIQPEPLLFLTAPLSSLTYLKVRRASSTAT